MTTTSKVIAGKLKNLLTLAYEQVGLFGVSRKCLDGVAAICEESGARGYSSYLRPCLLVAKHLGVRNPKQDRLLIGYTHLDVINLPQSQVARSGD